MPRPKYTDGRLQVAASFVSFTDPKGKVHVMLGRRQHGKKFGHYTFPGGNVDDTGETIEEAALRELKEETNLNLTNKKNPVTKKPLKLKKYDTLSYQNPSKDVHVFHADLGQLSYEEIDQLKQQVKAKDDLAQVKFMSYEALQKMPNGSVTGQNMRIIDEYANSVQAAFVHERSHHVSDDEISDAEINDNNEKCQSHPEPKRPTSIHDQRASLFSANKTPSSMQTFTSNPAHYNKDAKKQAEAIWQTQVEPLLRQGKSVGLIYSANNQQAKNIYTAYQSGAIANTISGGGQAKLFQEIAKIIQAKKLQDRVHILPIATSKSGGDNTLPGNQVSLADIDRDLQNIASHRAFGWEIRGLGKKSGLFVVGGGYSKGWHDQNNAQIVQQSDGSYVQTIKPNVLATRACMSQGDYVDMSLFHMSTMPAHQWPPHLHAASKIQPTLMRSESKPKSHAKASPTKWETFVAQKDDERPSISTSKASDPISLYQVVNPKAPVASDDLEAIETQLKKGKILLASPKQTVLDQSIRNDNDEIKNGAADLVAIYSVKNVMGDLATRVNIQMVDNHRANKGHDKHAMKVQFSSKEEARAFSKKLFKEHGIHSFTFGPGVMKTPQNMAIYLTKEDLEKIAKNAKITQKSGSGKLAYQTKATSFEQHKNKNVHRDDEAVPLEPRHCSLGM